MLDNEINFEKRNKLKKDLIKTSVFGLSLLGVSSFVGANSIFYRNTNGDLFDLNNSDDSNFVKLTGNQSISGIKTFNNNAIFNSDISSLAFVTTGGISSQFVKGDGSLDSSTYITSVNWDEINGTQTDINLSGFTNDLSYEVPLTFSTGLTRTTNTITTNDSQINHNSLQNTHNLTTDIDHNTLSNYEVGQHRTINDSATSVTDLWSASKINTELSSKEDSLGNPMTNGYILSSLTNGTRSWIELPEPDLNSLVPYIGATNDVELGDNGLQTKFVKNKSSSESEDIIIVSGAGFTEANGTYIKNNATTYTKVGDVDFVIVNDGYSYYGNDWEIRWYYYGTALYGLDGAIPIGTWTTVGWYGSNPPPTSVFGEAISENLIENGNIVINNETLFPKDDDGVEFTGEGINFMWISSKKALRAGVGANNRWNKENIGEYSVVFGDNCEGSGTYGLVQGENSRALGDYDLIVSRNSIVNGNYGIAVGVNHNLNSNYNFGVGQYVNITGTGSVGFGNQVSINGVFSGAWGSLPKVIGNYSYTFGDRTECNDNYSVSFGRQSKVNNQISQAFGDNVIVNGRNSTGFGSFITIDTDYTAAFGHGEINFQVSRDKGVEFFGRIADINIINENELGDNLISNSTFSDGTDWSFGAGWALGTNEATKNANGTGYLEYTGTFNIEIGKMYEVEFEITGGIAGNFWFEMGGKQSTFFNAVLDLGVNKTYITVTDDTDKIKFRTQFSTNRINISNIYVRECVGGNLNVFNELNVNKRLILPVKETTGDLSDPVEGLMYVNNSDNKVRVYAGGAWRDLVTW